MYTVSSIKSNRFCNQGNDEVDEFISKYILNQTGDRNMGIFKGSIGSVLQKAGNVFFGTGGDDSSPLDQYEDDGNNIESGTGRNGKKEELAGNDDEDPENRSRGNDLENSEYKKEDEYFAGKQENNDSDSSMDSESSTSEEENGVDEDIQREEGNEENEQDNENLECEYEEKENEICYDTEFSETEDDSSKRVANGDIWSNKKIRHINVKILSKPLIKHVNEIQIDRKTNTIKICFGWNVQKCPHYIDFLPALKTSILKTNVQSIPNLRNARVTKNNSNNKSSDYEITVEGTNVGHVFKISPRYIDHNKIRFNDIQTVYKYYGVEAARQCIINELRNVFSVYGINVDYRHLTLISDSITSSGRLRVFNRMGSICHNVSPFLQMSFETSIKFLTEACLRNARDNLKSPASSISIGRMARIGTGMSRTLTEFKIKKGVGRDSKDNDHGCADDCHYRDINTGQSKSHFKFL